MACTHDLCIRYRPRTLLAPMVALFCYLFGACGPSHTENNNDTGNNNNEGPGCVSDQDGDFICDRYEGGDETDTDGDGTPDYLDLDSDGDGISDSVEWGGLQAGNPPADHDGDGTPDFRDLDSDNNGIPDQVDGAADIDGDGIGNFADMDDDGDGIMDTVELGPDPFTAPDTDGDGTFDYQDVDSDGDTILDGHEGGGGLTDTDNDTIPDYLDLDSDNDGISDMHEAGDLDPMTAPVDTDEDLIPDYRDVDSDNDGLADKDEDLNHNGVLDPGESDPYNEDTDNDGVSDLVEMAAGTDAQDPADNPRENGDFVFFEPFEEPPDPTEDRLDFSTSFNTVDIYVLEDVSGSMSGEITSIKTSLGTMIDEITCGPGEDPAIHFCVPDLESGCGRFGRSGETWSHLKDINPDHAATETALPSTASGGSEQHIRAMSGAISGSCGSDPSRIGVACFRQNSLGIIVLISDENFQEDSWDGGGNEQSTYDNMANLGIRVIGVTGDDSANEVASLRNDFLGMSGGTPSVNLVPAITQIPNTTQCNALGGSPFYNNRAIVDGPNADAANAMTCAIQAITAYLPQDVYAEMVNDPSNLDAEGNPVDAIAAFVDYIEVYQDPNDPACSDGLTVQDTNGDTHPDMYVAILPGTPVCWKLFVKQNDTVEQSTTGPQMFMATVNVHGEGGALLDSRDVYFLVPPEIEGPGVPQ